MRITEKGRLALRQELERVFQNPRFADIATEAMPPIDYDKLATKDDLNTLGSNLRAEMANLRSDLRVGMADLRSDMNTKFASHMRLTFLMQMATFGGTISYLNAVL